MKWFKTLLNLIFFVWLSSSAFADKLIYVPVNPSFGGNPSNGTNLLSEANAQNPYKDSSSSSTNSLSSFSSALATALQNSQVNSLASQASSSKVGDTFNIGNYKGVVVNEGNGKLAWLITDTTTGETTTVIIGGQ